MEYINNYTDCAWSADFAVNNVEEYKPLEGFPGFYSDGYNVAIWVGETLVARDPYPPNKRRRESIAEMVAFLRNRY